MHYLRLSDLLQLNPEGVELLKQAAEDGLVYNFRFQGGMNGDEYISATVRDVDGDVFELTLATGQS